MLIEEIYYFPVGGFIEGFKAHDISKHQLWELCQLNTV